MSEKNLWTRLRKGLKPFLELQRLEDRYSKGVPDVLYAGDETIGVVELKYLRAWPKRPTTLVRLPTLKPEQRAWLQWFGEVGHLVHLLLQVGRDELILFDWPSVQQLGHMTRSKLYLDNVWLHQGRMTQDDYWGLSRALLGWRTGGV